MPRRIRRWSRNVAAGAAAVVLACAATVLPASAAHAAGGTDWSSSWYYYASNAFTYKVTLPGVQTTGYAVDNYGTRSVYGQVNDNLNDAYCAKAIAVVNGSTIVANLTACNGQNLTYQTGRFTGQLSVFAFIATSDGHPIVGNLVTVPSSSSDPGLRTVDTGAQWEYYTDTSFHYKVRRTGVLVEGYGANQWDGSRTAGSYVQNTGSGGCATGVTRDNNGRRAQNTTCTPGGVAYFNGSGFVNDINVDACAPGGCLTHVIVKPNW
jgi:hypothetical protein